MALSDLRALRERAFGTLNWWLEGKTILGKLRFHKETGDPAQNLSDSPGNVRFSVSLSPETRRCVSCRALRFAGMGALLEVIVIPAAGIFTYGLWLLLRKDRLMAEILRSMKIPLT